MDELDRALRSLLTDERLDLPVRPGAARVVHEGVRRRRRRSSALLAASVAVVVAAAVGTATALTGSGHDAVGPPAGGLTTPTPTPSGASKPPLPPTTTTVVPWAGTAYDFRTPPVFPGAAARPDVPWCRAPQLAMSVFLQGATGNLVGAVQVTNRSATTCAVQGEPAVQVRTATGRVLLATQPDVFYVNAWVPLSPGAAAAAGVQWMQEFCHEPAPATMTIALPHDGGSLSAPSTGAPRCNAPGDPRSTGSMTVSGFVRRGSDDSAFTPEASLQASIDHWPHTVVAGGPLAYRVQLQTLQDQPVRLDPCLPYRERLVDRTGHVLVEEDHVLNCAAAPASIDPVTSGHTTEFAMQIATPTHLPPGDYSLLWQSVLQNVSAAGGDVIHVTAPPPPCAEGQLTLSAGPTGAAGGSYESTVVLTNDSATDCSLRGYPGVQFVDRQGRPLPTTPHHGGSMTFPDLPVSTVALAAHGGTASFRVGGVDFVPPAGATPCTATEGLLVIPPGLRHQVLVNGVGEDCQNGAVDVSVVVAGTAGPRWS